MVRYVNEASWELCVYAGIDADTRRRRYRSATVHGNCFDAERVLAVLVADTPHFAFVAAWTHPTDATVGQTTKGVNADAVAEAGLRVCPTASVGSLSGPWDYRRPSPS